MRRLLQLSALFYIVASVAFADEMPLFNKEQFIETAAYETELQLGMGDCVGMALKNNSEILVKKITPLIEDENILIKRGKFDPVLFFDGSVQENFELSDRPLISPSPSKTRTGIMNAGVAQKWTTGTVTTVELDTTRTRSNQSPLFQSFNPAFDSKARVTVVQPLLKGAGITVNKAEYLIAKNDKLKSDQDLVRDVIKVVTETKTKYYLYQYTREQYKVAQTSLKRVQDLYTINKEKFAKGLASDIDVVEAEAEVARFEEALLAAENMMLSAEDELKYVTNLVDDPKYWNARITLLDPVSFKQKEFDLVKCILVAFDYRPEYKTGMLDLKNRDIAIIFNRNGVLPTLDVTGSYGLNGLGKTYEKSLGHIGSLSYRDWSVGVAARMPFFDDEGKGKYAKSVYEKEQALIAFKRLEQRIILEVRNAWRDVDIKYRIVLAAEKAKSAEELNYAAQESRFKAGLVSTLDIVTYQERLARAQVNYLKGVIDYNVSLLELSKAQGTTLIEDHIRIE